MLQLWQDRALYPGMCCSEEAIVCRLPLSGGKLTALGGQGHPSEGSKHLTQSSGTHVTTCISPVNVADTLHAVVQLFGLTCSFLIDTGAAVSLISCNTWKRHSTVHELEPLLQRRLVSVDGAPLHVFGTAQVSLMVAGVQCTTNLVVVDGLTVEGILGLDFLQQYQCSVDVAKQHLYLHNGSLCVQLINQKPAANNAPVVATISEATMIPAQSECEVLATVKGSVASQQTLLVEHSLPDHCKVRVARSITKLVSIPNQGSQIVVRTINPTDQPVTKVRR